MTQKIALLDTERGYLSIQSRIDEGAVELFRADTFQEAEQRLHEIARRKREFSRIVVDQLSTLLENLSQELLLQGANPETVQIWDRRNRIIPTQQDWHQLGRMVKAFLKSVMDIGLPTIFVCQERREGDDSAPPVYTLAITPTIGGDIIARSDAVVHYGRVAVAQTIGTKAVRAGSRVLRLTYHPQYPIIKGRDAAPHQRPEFLIEPTYSQFLEVCKPHPIRTVVYGPPGVGKTTFACSP